MYSFFIVNISAKNGLQYVLFTFHSVVFLFLNSNNIDVYRNHFKVAGILFVLLFFLSLYVRIFG